MGLVMWKVRFTPWTKMQAREPAGHALASSGCTVYTGWYWMIFSLMCHTLHLSVPQWDADNVFFPLAGRRKTLLAPHTHLTPTHVAVYLQLLPEGHPTCTPQGRLHTSVPSARYSLVAQGERTQPDVLHQLAEEWQQLNLLTRHPQLRPAHAWSLRQALHWHDYFLFHHRAEGRLTPAGFYFHSYCYTETSLLSSISGNKMVPHTDYFSCSVHWQPGNLQCLP